MQKIKGEKDLQVIDIVACPLCFGMFQYQEAEKKDQ